MFAVVASPNSPVASAALSTKRLCSARDTSSRRPVSAASSGYGVVGWATIAPVGVDATDPMTIVRSRSAPTRWVSLAATRRSNASRQSTPALLAWFDTGTSPRLSRRSLTTGPAFCDSPVWSSPRTTQPSSIAAVPSTWLTVITPVPPMPDSRTVKLSVGTTAVGAGNPAPGSPVMPDGRPGRLGARRRRR